jgi:NADH dehydrogenase [ubiquinone] 1 alpha subcomplex assembly factor 6
LKFLRSIFFRRGDFENYLCSLLLPNDARAAAFAVRAFNIEVARVADQTRDADRGAMRMQFWRDVLDRAYSSARGEQQPHATPVAVELSKALAVGTGEDGKKQRLSKRWLSRLIQARMDRLPASRPFRSLKEVEEYGEQVASSVNYLILEALGTTYVPHMTMSTRNLDICTDMTYAHCTSLC